jgi:hypothetical protein
LIGADAENSNAVFAALGKFGAPIEGLSAKDFAEPDNLFRMGTPPVMVDIMPKISGVEFEEAWRQLDQVKKEGREEWLTQREQKGSSPTLEEIRAGGREDWLTPMFLVLNQILVPAD